MALARRDMNNQSINFCNSFASNNDDDPDALRLPNFMAITTTRTAGFSPRLVKIGKELMKLCQAN